MKRVDGMSRDSVSGAIDASPSPSGHAENVVAFYLSPAMLRVEDVGIYTAAVVTA